MPTLPEPPMNLAEWLALIMLFGGVIGAARRWLVNPILKAVEQHAEDHALLVRELVANGSERELPYDLQREPLRKIAIRSLTIVERLTARIDEHDAFSRETIRLVNIDRDERGLRPLPGPPVAPTEGT